MNEYLQTTTFLLLLLTAVSIFLLNHLKRFKHDPKEPPLIPHRVPYVGHMIELIRNGNKYYNLIRSISLFPEFFAKDPSAKKVFSSRHPFPIYTLKILNGRTYIVNSPDLISAIQRAPKSYSFDPIITSVTERLSVPSKQGIDAVRYHPNGQNGEWGLNHDTMNDMHTTLKPGPILDGMNEKMLGNVSVMLDELDCEGGMVANLFEWARHTITRASTNAFFGPLNPFKALEIEEAFWTLEDKLTMILVNIAPAITTPKAHGAREACVRAFVSYFNDCGADHASALVKVRRANNTKYGISIEDQARFEVSNVFGILVNTAPATFWTISHIYSSPMLLEDIRQEIADTVVTEDKHNSSEAVSTIDIAKLKNSCPLLFSTFQEVLRITTHGVSVRWVVEDTMLADRYLMKKDSIIQMPSAVVHTDTNVWGPSAKEFDPRRFMKTHQKGDEQAKRHPAAFRTFGGGTTLCPGRHFATTEVVAVVAMLVLRYDITPLDGGSQGVWVLPKQDNNNVGTSVLPPVSDIKVRITKRKGWEVGKWAFTRSEEAAKFALSSG
ncbi:hypothetical protein MMC18_006992 [Xylographa bjoerkii]|nr:hypothetical protein [Xylographa bjoerkii]